MLQQPDSLGIDELGDHVAQDRADRVESLVGVADVSQPCLVEEDLLDDEDRHRLGELRAGLHDTEAERNDFGGQQEVNDGRVVILLD